MINDKVFDTFRILTIQMTDDTKKYTYIKIFTMNVSVKREKFEDKEGRLNFMGTRIRCPRHRKTLAKAGNSGGLDDGM